MEITCRNYGTTRDGSLVLEYRLTNKNGYAVTILDYGCTITSICVPANGKKLDVCLGYDTIGEYEQNDGYLGAVVGRHANRIAAGRFTLNGQEYALARNDNGNHLHGGARGFDKYVWSSRVAEEGLTFSRLSPDGEEGYPGNLKVRVTYALTEENELSISYYAETDADTVINLTNHAYFNLSGHDSGLVYDQLLQIFADSFTENDTTCLPTGRLISVKESAPFDFTQPKCIGLDIDADDVNLKNGSGYDHNFVLRGDGLKKAARVSSDKTGVAMEIYTTLPGLQFYSANFLTPRAGKNGAQYGLRQAYCLETQLFPNAMACENFPSPVLRAGETFEHRTIYKFV